VKERKVKANIVVKITLAFITVHVTID